MLFKESFAVDGRPYGRMVREQMRRVADDERLARRLDATAVAAVQLALLGGVGHPDAPVRGFHDVCGIVEGCFESEHVGIHARFNPVVGLDDGDPCASRLFQSAIAGGSVALVLLVDDADALVASGVCLHDGERAVRAAVVQADDLQLAVRLRENAVEALRKVRLRVEDRDDYRDELIIYVAHEGPFFSYSSTKSAHAPESSNM